MTVARKKGMEGMTMHKVYCDTGAFREELKELEQALQIELLMFPIENRNKQIRKMGSPTELTLADLKNVTLGEAPGTFADYTRSDKLDGILAIIGENNRRDALHIDSAHKSECSCFLTRDKTDIWARRTDLENLLGMRIFHADLDWDAFIRFISS
jgi:hypothetical protein